MRARLEYWMIVPGKSKKKGGFALRGESYGHPWAPDGKVVTTSNLLRIEGDADRAVCESGVYKLGPPDAGWLAEFKAAGHTLAEFGAGPARPLADHSSLASRLKALVGLAVMLTRDDGDTRQEVSGVLVRVEPDGLVVDQGEGIGERQYPSGDGWKVRRAQ